MGRHRSRAPTKSPAPALEESRTTPIPENIEREIKRLESELTTAAISKLDLETLCEKSRTNNGLLRKYRKCGFHDAYERLLKPHKMVLVPRMRALKKDKE